jgi:hypothetical protein
MIATFLAVFVLFALALAGLGIGWLAQVPFSSRPRTSQAAFTGGVCEVCGKTETCGTEQPQRQ